MLSGDFPPPKYLFKDKHSLILNKTFQMKLLRVCLLTIHELVPRFNFFLIWKKTHFHFNNGKK